MSWIARITFNYILNGESSLRYCGDSSDEVCDGIAALEEIIKSAMIHPTTTY